MSDSDTLQREMPWLAVVSDMSNTLAAAQHILLMLSATCEHGVNETYQELLTQLQVIKHKFCIEHGKIMESLWRAYDGNMEALEKMPYYKICEMLHCGGMPQTITVPIT